MLVQSQRGCRAFRPGDAWLRLFVSMTWVVGLILLTPSRAEAGTADYSANPVASGPSERVLETLCSFTPPDWIEPLTDDWSAPICDLSQTSAIAPAPVYSVAQVFWRSPQENQDNTWTGLNLSKDAERQLSLDTDQVHGLLPAPLCPRAVRIAKLVGPHIEQVSHAQGVRRPLERPPMGPSELQS